MNDMHRADFAAEGFRLFYQPVVWIRPTSGAVVLALEAFLRLEHPTQGLLMADSFVIPTRESGGMESLGSWVAQRACADLAGWRATGYRGRVNLNVTPSELTLEYAAAVQGALNENGLAGDLLLLDITPDAPLTSSPVTRQAIDNLRHLGVRLFLDDFGSGGASLKSLGQFPIAGIKFGRPPLSTDDPDALLLEELMELTNGSGRSLIVSRVESVAQRDCALQLGCRTMQGYLFSEAVPKEQVPSILQQIAAVQGVPGNPPASANPVRRDPVPALI